MIAQAAASDSATLTADVIRSTLEAALLHRFAGARVLVLIPDHTRTIPLPQLFPLLVELLADVRQLDFMIALGTHPPLSDEAICHLLGITPQQRREQYGQIGLLNHAWDNPAALTQIGLLTQDQIRQIAGAFWHESLGGDVPVRVNARILEYDQIIILGPTFPHEVVGFSGGAKYLFPGISGAEMINVTHWLGALMTIMGTIGIEQTPVREIIHTAAACVPTPILLISLVVTKENALAGLFVGDHIEAFRAAAALSAQRHIIWKERPYQRVLSYAPPMYDELWTGAKAMYKLEPVVADGGELIVYAPHLDVVSHVHGRYLYEVGYHVRDYFLAQWERFRHYPGGVLAHSTHLKGAGRFVDGVEQARIQVTLATRLSAEDCARLNLGYLDPAHIDLTDWQNREDDGVLFVPKAGEMLYRLR